MIPYSLEIGIPSLVNILDRETYDLAEEWSHLSRGEQLDRISDLRVLVQTIKQLTDDENACKVSVQTDSAPIG